MIDLHLVKHYTVKDINNIYLLINKYVIDNVKMSTRCYNVVCDGTSQFKLKYYNVYILYVYTYKYGGITQMNIT